MRLSQFIGLLVCLSCLSACSDQSDSGKEQAEPILVEMVCSEDQVVCRADLKDMRIELVLADPDLTPMQPLSMRLSLNGKEAHGAELQRLWLSGRDMFMGDHYFRPEPEDSNDDKSSWALEGMIPLCTQDKNMVWHANVEMELAGELVWFRADLQSQFPH